MADRIDLFFNELTEEAILTATDDFEKALREINAASPNAEVISTANFCNLMIDALNLSPYELSTASLVSDVLKGLDSLHNFVESQMVELRMTRALVMHSTWSLFSWPASIVQASMAFTYLLENTWIDRLVVKVWQAVAELQPGQREVVFSSEQFLPTIHPAIEFFYVIEHYRSSWSLEDVKIHVYYVTTAIIRLWLGFPNEEIYLARYSFLDAFLLNPTFPRAILYLDPLWRIYQNPKFHLLRGTQKTWNKNPQEQFKGFRDRLSHHPIIDPQSEHFQHLLHLQQHSEVWYTLRINTNLTPTGTLVIAKPLLLNWF